MKTLAIAALLVAFAGACNRTPYGPNEGEPAPPGTPPQAPPVLRFARIVDDSASALARDLQAGAEQAARDLGVEMKTYAPSGADAGARVAEQEKFIRAAIRERVDAILIAAADPKRLVAPLRDAADAGIAIVTFGVALDADEVRAQKLAPPPFVLETVTSTVEVRVSGLGGEPVRIANRRATRLAAESRAAR